MDTRLWYIGQLIFFILGLDYTVCYYKIISVTVVVISMITQTLLGFQIPGSKANLNDICPPYVAIGKSISNTFGSMPGFIAPMIAGGLLDSYGNNQQTWGYIWALSGLGSTAAVRPLVSKATLYRLTG